MSTTKQIVLIPFWVQETLRRNHLNLVECLNFKKIKPIMAMNDLVAFSTLQSYFNKLIGMEGGGTSFALLAEWERSVANDEGSLKKYIWDTVSVLEKDQAFVHEVETRLFMKDAKVDHYEQAFAVYDLTPTISGVVLYPGFFGENSTTELQVALVESVLKLLYVYQPYNEVSKAPLFKRYLQLLSCN